MKLLLPNSLFGRMVLVMVIGLILAQVLSAAILLQDRERWELQIRAARAAQQIGDAVRLLDNLTEAEREKLVPLLSTRTFSINMGDTRFPSAAEPEMREGAEAFAETLHQALEGTRAHATAIVYEVASAMDDRKAVDSEAKGMGMPSAGSTASDQRQRGPALLAQVSLADGSAVGFSYQFFPRKRPVSSRLLVDLMVRLTAVVILSLIAVRWVTRPLSALAVAAEGIGENINRPPLPENGPTEVKNAARAFNRMQTRLLSYLRDRTRVLAAISHDLKTPITRLRLRSELLSDPALKAKFTRDLEEMEAMVAASLEFMQGIDSREPWQAIDIVALVESLQQDAQDGGGWVEMEGAAQPYPGKPMALKRCLNNLIDNAVKYGKRAEIRLIESPETLVICIRDAGPGIPDDKLEQVFEPFFRLEASRNRNTGGTGLGLSIARNIAEAHGGSLVLHNPAEGGLEAVLSLPRTRRDGI